MATCCSRELPGQGGVASPNGSWSEKGRVQHAANKARLAAHRLGNLGSVPAFDEVDAGPKMAKAVDEWNEALGARRVSLQPSQSSAAKSGMMNGRGGCWIQLHRFDLDRDHAGWSGDCIAVSQPSSSTSLMDEAYERRRSRSELLPWKRR